MSNGFANPDEVRTLRSYPEADVVVGPFVDGHRSLVVRPKTPSFFAPRLSVSTTYPDDLILLILELKGPTYVCDEIARDEDPTYVQASLELGLMSFLPLHAFTGKRVLDFGCGAGSSTMILNRMLKGANIWAVELDATLLRIAAARSGHYGFPSDHLMQSPDGQTLPDRLGSFDVVVLSAVWEHLLPFERPAVMKQIWSTLKPGGLFFLNQTPHRFTPVETHTTGLPLINYLPDRLTLSVARTFSKRVKSDETWMSLLRRGIRGGTQREVMRLIVSSCKGRATLLVPQAAQGIRDLVDLWYKTSAGSRLRGVKRGMWALMKAVKHVTGAQIVPELTLAIQKES